LTSIDRRDAGFVVSGRLGVKMEGGEEAEFGPGDAFYVPPNHDSWTVGSQDCVMVDFHGTAKGSA
jgi:mannose-6-phosphate isomerase-like protein (cupin superfamily)